MIQTILITMTIGNPLSNPLHPKGSGGDFYELPLLNDTNLNIISS